MQSSLPDIRVIPPHPVLGLLAAPSPTLSTTVSQAAPVCCPGGARWTALQVPPDSWGPGTQRAHRVKELTDQDGSPALRRPHSRAPRCQPGQAPPLTSSVALGAPKPPESQLSHLYNGDDPENVPPRLPGRGRGGGGGGGGGGAGTGLQGQHGVQSGQAGWRPRAPRQAAPSARVGAMLTHTYI